MRVRTIDDPVTMQAFASPIRMAALQALREPLSAAGVARELGEPRQKMNYHFKELERAGLIRHAGERRRGNFVEQLYEAVAGRFVMSPTVAWDRDSLAAALKGQASLGTLVALGEQLQVDAVSLLDRASRSAEPISSAAVQADVSFPSEEARSAFLEEYLAAIGPLLKKHGARQGDPFRVLMAVYPNPEEE